MRRRTEKGAAILNRGGVSRLTTPETLSTAVSDLGRVLRQAREDRGLTLEEACERSGLPPPQVEALESGSVELLPDGVHVLASLRRYADFLGLRGDHLVLKLVDNWPVPDLVVDSGNGAPDRHQPLPPTGTDPVAPTGLVDTGPATMRATQVASQGVGSSPADGRDPITAQVPLPVADTGVIPAVPSQRHLARGARAPLALRLLFALVALALVVGVAGLVIHKVRPQWLRTLGISRIPGLSQPTPASQQPTTPSTTAPPNLFKVASVNGATATIDVRSSRFVVRVVASGGAAWVQATDSQHTSPIFAKTLSAGQTQTFDASHDLTVEVGSSAGHLYVAVGGKLVGYYLPPSAPFTVNFRSTS